MARNEYELYPSFSAEIEEIRKNGISPELISKIIQKHLPNSLYNKQLYKRYMAISSGVPIFSRQPRYEEENPINNKVNNDFFGEIIDFKVGYFAGEPITYGYSKTKESEEVTGGEKAVDEAIKTITDFTTRNNMYGVDMEVTKNASIYGYSGRLFYIDEKDGTERVMPIHGYETIILSDIDISEPEFAIRYYKTTDINNVESWEAIFYDNKYRTTFKGDLLSFQEVETKPHLFDYCPLQGVANNKECIGDAEKVLALIDDYDKVVSDNSNEIEAFVHALLLVNLNTDDGTIQKAQKSGSLIIPPIGTNQNSEPVKWLTKNINDAYTEHHLERLEDNIYRFSRTPNLGDESFGNASGVSLEYKLNGLKTKCATFKANVMNSAQHMWRVLCSIWNKKGIKIDPLQIIMEFHNNIPIDSLTEAQTAQAFIGAGLPKEWVFSKISGIDDVDYIMELLKSEQEDIADLYPNLELANQTANEDSDNKQLNSDKGGNDNEKRN